jgi:hypothetical protein
MKLNEGFLDSMKEAFTRFRNNDPAAAAEIVTRAMRGDTDMVPAREHDETDMAATRTAEEVRRPPRPTPAARAA